MFNLSDSLGQAMNLAAEYMIWHFFVALSCWCVMLSFIGFGSGGMAIGFAMTWFVILISSIAVTFLTYSGIIGLGWLVWFHIILFLNPFMGVGA